MPSRSSRTEKSIGLQVKIKRRRVLLLEGACIVRSKNKQVERRIIHLWIKEKTMKKAVSVVFAATFLMLLVAFAQDTMKPDDKNQDSTKSEKMSKKAVTISGKVGDDAKTFVSDKDGKTWKVRNPDALMSHQGHHVRVKAHVDADKDEIHVASVRMAKDKDSMKKDDMHK